MPSWAWRKCRVNSYASRRCQACYRNPLLRLGFTTLLRSITFDFNSLRCPPHSQCFVIADLHWKQWFATSIEEIISLKKDLSFSTKDGLLFKKIIFSEFYDKITQYIEDETPRSITFEWIFKLCERERGTRSWWHAGTSAYQIDVSCAPSRKMIVFLRTRKKHTPTRDTEINAILRGVVTLLATAGIFVSVKHVHSKEKD